MSKDIFAAFCKTVESDCYFSKVRILDRWVASLFETAFKKLKVTPHQFNLLVSIQSMGDIASAKMISKYLRMEKSTVSRDLKNLIAKGYIKETIHSLDSRNKKLRLTKPGETAIISCQAAWDEAQQKAQAMFKENLITLQMKPARERNF